MATIGLDRLYYAEITENDAGEETYGIMYNNLRKLKRA